MIPSDHCGASLQDLLSMINYTKIQRIIFLIAYNCWRGLHRYYLYHIVYRYGGGRMTAHIILIPINEHRGDVIVTCINKSRFLPCIHH